MTCWKLRWQHFFNKVFSKLTGLLSLLWCFTLKRLKYSGTQCFACTWKPKNSYDLLYWNICSIAVAWNQNLNISGVCLYSWYHPSLVSTDNVIMLTFSSKWFHPKLFSCTMANIAATELNHNSSVQSLSCDQLFAQPHEPQHARLPCPSPTPGVYPNSCPVSQWCHLTISSSVVPFSSCLQSFPTSGSFQMSQLFASGGQNTAFSFNISPSNEQPGLISFRMDWLDLLAVQGTLKSLLQHHSSKASILLFSAFFIVQLSQ